MSLINPNIPNGSQLASKCIPKLPDMHLPNACTPSGGTGTGGTVFWSDIENIPPCISDCETLNDYVVDIISAYGITTADNGLTKVGNTVKLGGELLVDTVLFNNNNNPFSFSISLTDSAIESSQSAITVWREEGNFGINLDASNDLFGSNIELSSQEANMVFLDRTSNLSTDLIFSPIGNSFTDDRLQKGLRYGGNYFTNNTGVNYNPRWIPDLGYVSSAFAPALGSASYIHNQTAAVQLASFRVNTGQFQGGGEALKVGTDTGNANHAYMGFYARTATPTVKSARIGFTYAGSSTLAFENELSGGPIQINTYGGGTISLNAVDPYAEIILSAANRTEVLLEEKGVNMSFFNLSSDCEILFGTHTANTNQLEIKTPLGFYSAGSKVVLRTHSGTVNPNATINTNTIGQYVFGGYKTTGYTSQYDSVSIRGIATENWSSTAGGSKIELYTTPNTTITQKLALTVDQDSSVRTWGGGESLKVGTDTGNLNSASLGFYARNTNPTLRTGRLGYTSNGDTTLTFQNEISNGMLLFRAQGGGSTSIWTNGLGITSTGSGGTIGWDINIGGFSNSANMITTAYVGSLSQGAKHILRTMGGTEATKVASLSGQVMGTYMFGAATSGGGISFDSLAIKGVTTENWSGTTAGSKLEFYTTPNGTISQSLSATLVYGNFTLPTALTIGSTVLTEPIMKMGQMTLSTGLYFFGSGGLTVASGSTFNVGAVQGYSVDNTTVTAPVPTFVNYGGATGLTTPYLATSPATYVALTPAGILDLQPSEPSEEYYRTNILLGVIGHPNGVITGTGNKPDIMFNTADQMRDMFKPIKFINDGVLCYPNSTDLTMANTAGKLYGLGIGFVINGKNRPSSISIAAGAPTTFQYRTQTGGTFTNTTLIDPANYDVASVVTPIGGGSNSSTNQRIYLLENGAIRIQYGQTIYATLASAIASAQSEPFNVFTNVKTLGTLIGILSVSKGCINLSDTATARFLAVSKFGEAVGAAAGISTATLQSAYNNSIIPNITTNNTLGAFSVRRGSASDSDNTLVVQNGAGAINFRVNGNGQATATGGYFADGSVGYNNGGTTTATAGTASPNSISPTLVATANSNELIGLDIAPTFTIGAFTSVKTASIRVSSDIIATGTANLGTSTNVFSSAWVSSINSIGTLSLNAVSVIDLRPASVTTFRLFTSGNATFQNGGVFTDNGHRLEVVGGTTRLTGNTFIGTNTASAYLAINGTNNSIRAAFFQTAGVFRWRVGADIISETGSGNTGSNFEIGNYSDGGFALITPFSINRASGTTTFLANATASAGLARGIISTPTLIASANNDLLIGLDVAPTFSNGAFSPVTQLGIRSQGIIRAQIVTGGRAEMYGSGTTDATFNASAGGTVFLQSAGISGMAVMTTTKNVVFQNGSTFIDDGVNRIQVTGTVKAINYTNATATLSGTDINFLLEGSRYKTITADTTFTMTNAAEGRSVDMAITASGADRTITISGVIWKGNPSLIITNGNTAIIFLKQINGTVWGTFAQ